MPSWGSPMIGFYVFTGLMNGHFVRSKWLYQIEGFSRGAGKPSLIVVWLQNNRHPVGMHFDYQLVRFRGDDRGRQKFSRLVPVNSIKKGPNSGKCKRWSRIFTFQPEPKIGGRSLSFRLTKTGGWDQAAPFLKTRLPESRRPQLVISGVVHSLRLDWKSGSGRFLGQHKSPMSVF